ncbi:MAG: hypothetical protein NC413_00880 [Muribaculum sp.]|nr:hypothetical protein [Muribaculum sp.]
MSMDFGSFFSSTGSSNSSNMSNFLSDYASIKNGSYGRLMKAYYKQTGSSSTSSTTSSTKKTKTTVDDIIAEKMQRSRKTESAESKAYTKVMTSTNDLQKSVDKLSRDSLFEQKLLTSKDENGVETTQFGYDKDEIYNAVNDFVKSYNSVLTAANSANNSSINSRMASIEKITNENSDALKQLGITIKADNSLSIDKDTFMKADVKAVQNMFKDTIYSSVLKANADMMRDNAHYEQLRANTYTYDGTFDSAYNSGSTYSSTM